MGLPQKEQEEQRDNNGTAVEADVKRKGRTKLVLQIGEWIGYSLLGITGFSWLFWFNSPFYEFIEVPVIAGIVLIAASLIYDNKNRKAERLRK